ncbi:hypothetical protein COU54_04445 [Candidatus Pacearchaeota archaeon CG10_big_fil_rev_8_21_14_0_10_31_24]|nr:MAG: hypothetical protein COU54_04445 [Candidatus Pacearchaeota archaeon CG10_big_fil_rev_8_21_14_0_10_31_24]
MILKLLGAIDLVSAFAFLLLTFGIDPYTQYILFCAGLLFFKGLFVFTGDVLSGVDLFSSLMLILSLFITLPVILIWIPTFLLLAKGVVSLF